MDRRPLGRTGIQIAPLVLGGNVFGWTADEATSFALLDRFVAGGGNAIDTADIYSVFAPGNKGGESETIIGNWLRRTSGNRSKVVIITKVGGAYASFGRDLTAAHIITGVEESLRRLQTDYIDVYFSHLPDAKTPIEETLRAHDQLVRAGKVHVAGGSNYDVLQLREALEVAAANSLARYDVLQPEYNLCERGFEKELRDLCIAQGIGVVTYFSLAAGFLSGKYRTPQDLAGRARGHMLHRYFNDRGLRILNALDTVANAHGAQDAEVALAWLIAKPGVTAPIASATSLSQLESLLKSTALELTSEDIATLDRASG